MASHGRAPSPCRARRTETEMNNLLGALAAHGDVPLALKRRSVRHVAKTVRLASRDSTEASCDKHNGSTQALPESQPRCGRAAIFCSARFLSTRAWSYCCRRASRAHEISAESNACWRSPSQHRARLLRLASGAKQVVMAGVVCGDQRLE